MLKEDKQKPTYELNGRIEEEEATEDSSPVSSISSNSSVCTAPELPYTTSGNNQKWVYFYFVSALVVSCSLFVKPVSLVCQKDIHNMYTFLVRPLV